MMRFYSKNGLSKFWFFDIIVVLYKCKERWKRYLSEVEKIMPYETIILLSTAIIGTITVGLQLGTILFLIIDAIHDKIKRRKGK